MIDLNQMEDHAVTDLPQICRNVLENAARHVLAFLLPYGHHRLHLWESSLLGTLGGLRFQSRRHFIMLKSKNKVDGILQLLLCWCDPSGESCLKDVEGQILECNWKNERTLRNPSRLDCRTMKGSRTLYLQPNIRISDPGPPYSPTPPLWLWTWVVCSSAL